MFMLWVASTCSVSAWAQSGPPVSWICWLGTQTDYNIHCVRESDPLLDEPEDGSRDPYDGVRVQGEFPGAGKSSSVNRHLREAPVRYQGIVWSIPLYTMPFDSSEVGLLARTILCGVDARCAVDMDTHQQHAMRD